MAESEGRDERSDDTDRARRRRPAPSRRRVVAVVALWATVMGAVSLTGGCYGHNCDGDVVLFGKNPGEGELISPDKWESNPTDGAWLDFRHQRAWVFEFHDLQNRAPTQVTPYVTAQSDPIHQFGNFTIAAGNLAEISGVDSTHVTIHNGTCADYFLRLVVEVSPVGFGDGGSDAEAGDAATSDAAANDAAPEPGDAGDAG